MLNITKAPLLDFGNGDQLYPRDVITYDRFPIDMLRTEVSVTQEARERLDRLGISNLHLQFAVPAVTVFGHYPEKPVLSYQAQTHQFKLDYKFELASCDPIDDVATIGLSVAMGLTVICMCQHYTGHGSITLSEKHFKPIRFDTTLESANVTVVDQDGLSNPDVTREYMSVSEQKSYRACSLTTNNKRTGLFYECRQYLGIDYIQDGHKQHVGIVDQAKYDHGRHEMHKYHQKLGKIVRESGGDIDHYFTTTGGVQ